MRAYQRRDLQAASLFFTTSGAEAENIRVLGLKQPIAIIPNGVEIPRVKAGESRLGEDRPARKLLFLSRIHPKKGLLNLLEAWGGLDLNGWELCITGPDECGHLAEVEAKVDALGISQSVEFVGEVDGEAKEALFRQADLFVLPSFSENFGVVVAEALAYGVPVIATQGTPWQGLRTHDCGWWVAPTAEDIRAALLQAVSMSETELAEMGERGRVYAREFDWSHIAAETAAVYRWLVGEGERPDSVITD